MKDHDNCRLTVTPNQSRWTNLQLISCCTLRTGSTTQLKPLPKTSPQLQESIPTPRAQMGDWKSGAHNRATMEERPTEGWSTKTQQTREQDTKHNLISGCDSHNNKVFHTMEFKIFYWPILVLISRVGM